MGGWHTLEKRAQLGKAVHRDPRYREDLGRPEPKKSDLRAIIAKVVEHFPKENIKIIKPKRRLKK